MSLPGPSRKALALLLPCDGPSPAGSPRGNRPDLPIPYILSLKVHHYLLVVRTHGLLIGEYMFQQFQPIKELQISDLIIISTI